MDWRLPTKDELNKMYVNFHSYGVGNFDNDYYWSSSENISNNAWYHYFYNGYQDDNFKYNKYRVRAVQTFETVYVDNYEIGQELEDGFIFDIQGVIVFICKKQDEDDVYTWDDAIKLFKEKEDEVVFQTDSNLAITPTITVNEKYEIVVNEKTITLNKQEAEYLKNALNELLK